MWSIAVDSENAVFPEISLYRQVVTLNSDLERDKTGGIWPIPKMGHRNAFTPSRIGAVTTALLNGELVIRSYRGSEFRLRSLSR